MMTFFSQTQENRLEVVPAHKASHQSYIEMTEDLKYTGTCL
jgi:hypothetical protein